MGSSASSKEAPTQVDLEEHVEGSSMVTVDGKYDTRAFPWDDNRHRLVSCDLGREVVHMARNQGEKVNQPGEYERDMPSQTQPFPVGFHWPPDHLHVEHIFSSSL